MNSNDRVSGGETGGPTAAASAATKPEALVVHAPTVTATAKKNSAAAAAAQHSGRDGGTFGALNPGAVAVDEPAGTASEKKRPAAAAAAQQSCLNGRTFDERLKQKLASDAETGGGAAASTERKPGVFTVNEPAGTASEKRKAAAAAAARHYSHDGGTLDERLKKKLASSADSSTSESEGADVKRTSVVLVSKDECAAAEKSGDRDPQGNSSAAGVAEPGSTPEDENVEKSMPLDVEPGQHRGDGGEIKGAPEGQGLRSGERPSLLGRVGSTLYAHVSATGEYLISATLVEEDDGGEVVMAERVGFFERRGKVVALALCFVLLAAIFPLVHVALVVPLRPDVPSMLPSMLPSSSPSFDLRPTLDIVKERGFVRCGYRSIWGNLTVRQHSAPSGPKILKSSNDTLAQPCLCRLYWESVPCHCVCNSSGSSLL
jgi:hypothetical protein